MKGSSLTVYSSDRQLDSSPGDYPGEIDELEMVAVASGVSFFER
jgi:hypothetical protein